QNEECCQKGERLAVEPVLVYRRRRQVTNGWLAPFVRIPSDVIPYKTFTTRREYVWA
ncbi:unnamed protein product, partial [Candidula unifasciata]